MNIEDRKICMRYQNTAEAQFIRRINRFTAEVSLQGARSIVHVKNTGRLRELLTPGAVVTLQRCGHENRKTLYDLISVYKENTGWVNIDSLSPNMLMKQYLAGSGYDTVKPEYSFGDSRFDFYMEKNGQKYLTEVKGCTLAYDPENGVGRFPDAPTARGVKHLRELADASGNGYCCAVAFVITMNGFYRVDPNDETQPAFRTALIEAVNAGVRVICYGCKVEADKVILSEENDDTMRFVPADCRL